MASPCLLLAVATLCVASIMSSQPPSYSSPLGQQACNNFAASFSAANTSIILVEYHQNGSQFPTVGQVASCGGPYKANVTNNLCRIVTNTSTSPTSSVQLEAWLPDEWNHRLLATGNGGEGGCVDYLTVQYAASFGFASLGTNGGHNGSVGYDFFLNQPEVQIDFGYRAIHVEAEVGKEIARQYYGEAANKNYYFGCSTGGRQGFQTAMMYPEDFDGVLNGSPGIDWLHIVSSKGILAHRIGWPHLNSSRYVREDQWKAIIAQQIRLFDPLDGVTDGIIDDPTMFRFDPEILACGAGVLNGSVCLNPDQVNAVRSAYEPIANTAGQIVYPPFELGSNTDVFSANINASSGQPQLSYTILQDFWRGAIHNSTTWTPLDFNETDMDFALSINPGRVNTGETDLSAFKARGGKVIAYHGRNDETVTSALSARYFTGVQQTLNATLDEMHDFYRLFYIPGMHHCSTGAGAWDIGQVYPLDPRMNSTDHNVLLSLVDWVENDAAPEHLIGTKYANDLAGPQGVVQAQRRHCVYPSISKWDTRGNTTLASSWNCVAPGQWQVDH